jgi:hypothetical protein
MIVKVNERAANTDRILKDGDSIEIISRRKWSLNNKTQLR